jgi:hypothetical protein
MNSWIIVATVATTSVVSVATTSVVSVATTSVVSVATTSVVSVATTAGGCWCYYRQRELALVWEGAYVMPTNRAEILE